MNMDPKHCFFLNMKPLFNLKKEIILFFKFSSNQEIFPPMFP